MALCTICNATSKINHSARRGTIIRLKCGHFIGVRGVEWEGKYPCFDYTLAYPSVKELLHNEYDANMLAEGSKSWKKRYRVPT